jgi:predicted metal-dependent hydrolase
MTANQEQVRTAPIDRVKPRRIKFEFGEPTPMVRHFANNDLVFSHLIATLSMSFPVGEELFIRSVRRYRDQIADPVLRQQIRGFIGQEMSHGQEHRRLNDKLVEIGYSTRTVDTMLKGVERLEGWLPKRGPLAMTAAAEHFTAVLAERILSSQEVQDMAHDPEVKNLLMWHALEEVEHKAVAFDVYKAVGGREWSRIMTMVTMFSFAFPLIAAATLVSVVQDPKGRNPVRIARGTVATLRGPLFKGMTPLLLRYMKPGFHPSDIDNEALLEYWRAELFGTEGTLVDHLT